MYVIPAPGLKIPDPQHLGMPDEVYFLPAAGRNVGTADLFYWKRLARDGEVQLLDQPPQGADASPTAADPAPTDTAA